MYPTDAITKTFTYTTAGTFTLIPTGDIKTYLSVSLLDSSNSAQKVSIGSDIVINKLVSAQNDITRDLSIATTTPVIFVKLGTTVSTVNVTYVTYDRTILSTTTSTTTSAISTINGFTYGDIMVILLLIMVFTLLFFSAIKEFIFGVKVENPMKNKYNKDI